MRIVAGAWGGRRIAAASSGRPTTDRVRESLFSIWREQVEGARFLDLFCAGGAVGLEAASRGAARVVFVDRDRRALAVVRRNCAALGFAEYRALRGDLPRGLREEASQPSLFDLVYADPPYAFDAFEELLYAVSGRLAPHADVAVEHDRRRELPERVGDLSKRRTRVWGDSSISFYEVAESA